MNLQFFKRTPWKVTITLEQMEKDKKFFPMLCCGNQRCINHWVYTCYFTYYSWTGKGLYLDDLYVTAHYRKQTNRYPGSLQGN